MEEEVRKMKRGSVIDIVYILIIAFSLSILFVMVGTVGDALDADPFFAASGEWMSVSGTIDNLDSLLPWVIYGFFVAAFIMAAYVRSTPLMFGVGILFLLVIVFVTPFLSNTWETMSADASLTATTTETDTMWDNMPTTVLIMGCLILIALQIGGGNE